jgi:hypothetical protein
MVTNSRRASVSIVAGSVKERKTIHRVGSRPSIFGVSLRQSASEVSLRQLVSGIRVSQASEAESSVLAVGRRSEKLRVLKCS